jgi:hypothetical protein
VATEQPTTEWFKRFTRRALLCACVGCAAAARAATFESRGHYGFVLLGADEAPGATAFSARVEGPSGSGDVRRVYARPVGGGWQIYVGGWPAAAAGLSDLVLRAEGANGARELRLPQAVQAAAGRIDVALVIDDSFSMRKTDPARLRVSALTLFARIAASRGVVRTLSVVAFERRPRLLLSPTPPADAEAFEHAMAGLVARGSTDLDAALILADQTLATLPDSRKIVVVLSDGRDEPGRYEDSHRRFAASRIPVYTVGLSTLADSNTLDRIAQNTGGTFSFAPDMTRLEAIFQEIVLAIHNSVTIGAWDLTTDDADVPVDDSVRLLTLTLAADEDVQAVITPPDGGAAVALGTARASDALAERYAPARGLWRATGLGTLAATAESDLELVLFPPTGVVTDAVPQAVAALVLREGVAMTRGCDVSLTTGTGGAQQILEWIERGYFEGFVVPAGAGPALWQATARGVTDAGHPFQRVAVQRQRVAPMRRDALWVQPKPLVLELDPGCTVTGRVVIAGRGRFTADVQGFRAGGVSLLQSGGDIPEGRQLELGLAVTAGRDARPGMSSGQVVVAVGKLPRAEVNVGVRIRAPPIAIGPRELAWNTVAPGQAVTGTVWGVVQAVDRACRVQAVTLGFDGRSGGVRDVTLGVETTRWQIVIGTAGIGSTTQLTGRVSVSWGWDTVEVPWTVGVVVPEPEAVVTADPERAPEPDPVVVTQPVPESAPEPEPVIEPSPPEPEAEVAPSAAVAEPTSPPAAAVGGYNAWRIAAVLLLLLILLYLLWRMTRGEENRLAKYFAASLVMHVLVFLLSLDLLLQTRVVTLEQISPTLAVTVGALEEKLGFSIAPAAGAIAVKDTPSELDKQARAELSLAAAEARAAANLAQPDLSASAVAAMEAQTHERKPGGIERLADEAEREPAPTAEANPEEIRQASAKRAERMAQADAARSVELHRAVADGETAQRKAAAGGVTAGTDGRQPEAATVGLARVTPGGAAPEAAHPESLGPERQAAGTAAVAAETVTLAASAPRRAAAATGPVGGGPAAATVARAADTGGGAAQRMTTAGGVAAGADGRQPEAATVGLARVTPGGAAPEAAHPESLGPERQAAGTAAVAAETVTLAAGAPRRAAAATGPVGGGPAAATVARAADTGGGAAQRMTTAVGVAAGADGRQPEAATVGLARVVPGGAALGAAHPEGLGPERQAAGTAPVTAETVTLAAGTQRRAAPATGPVGGGPAAATVARAADTGGGAAQRMTTVVGVAAGADGRQPEAATVGLARVAPAGAAREAAHPESFGPERQAAGTAAVAAETVTLAAGTQRRAASAAGPAGSGPTAAMVARAAETVGGAAQRKIEAAVNVAAASEAHRPDAARNVGIDLPKGTGQPQQRQNGTAGDLALKGGSGGPGTVPATLALAQYGGDWDCARTAMMFLSHQLRERTGMSLMAGDTVVRLDQPELQRLPFVYLTGHKDFRFTDAEVRNLRDYLQNNGHLWADDSTHYRDETFDQAFRREIARVLPGAVIERLGADFDGWRTGYDLTRGYKGYAIPPGDKYRENYIEGIRINGRVAVVYTRNDYGDGLNIDPHTQPLKNSLTSLSPAEMQEGATRMGVNLVLFFLRQHGGIDVTFVDKASGGMRRASDPSDARPPEGPTRPIGGTGPAAAWVCEEWGDAAEGVEADGRLVVRFQVGSKEKTVFSRVCEPALAVRAGDTLLVDVESRLTCGTRVALGLDVDGRYLETAPFYIKPGRNTAFFVCTDKTFKSALTAWEYRDTLPLPAAVGKLNVLIYAPEGGEIRFGNFRIAGK